MNRQQEYEQFKRIIADQTKLCPSCGGQCDKTYPNSPVWDCLDCGAAWSECLVCNEVGHGEVFCPNKEPGEYFDPLTREIVQQGENSQLSQTDSEPEPEQIGLDDANEEARPIIAAGKQQVMRRAESMGLIVTDEMSELEVIAPNGYKFRANDSGALLAVYDYRPKAEAWEQIYEDLNFGMYPSTDAGYADQSTDIYHVTEAL